MFQTSNSYFVCHNPSTIDVIFERLRNYEVRRTGRRDVLLNVSYQGSSLTYPEGIAGLQVTRVVDLTVGYDSSNPPLFKPRLPLSSGHMIQFRAENKDQLCIVLTIRTSGTEPKVGHRNGFRYGDSFCFRLNIILKAMAEIVRPLQNFCPVSLKSLEMFGSRLRNTIWVPLEIYTGILES